MYFLPIKIKLQFYAILVKGWCVKTLKLLHFCMPCSGQFKAVRGAILNNFGAKIGQILFQLLQKQKSAQECTQLRDFSRK
jgi:hypothetical protein